MSATTSRPARTLDEAIACIRAFLLAPPMKDDGETDWLAEALPHIGDGYEEARAAYDTHGRDLVCLAVLVEALMCEPRDARTSDDALAWLIERIE